MAGPPRAVDHTVRWSARVLDGAYATLSSSPGSTWLRCSASSRARRRRAPIRSVRPRCRAANGASAPCKASCRLAPYHTALSPSYRGVPFPYGIPQRERQSPTACRDGSRGPTNPGVAGESGPARARRCTRRGPAVRLRLAASVWCTHVCDPRRHTECIDANGANMHADRRPYDAWSRRLAHSSTIPATSGPRCRERDGGPSPPMSFLRRAQTAGR